MASCRKCGVEKPMEDMKKERLSQRQNPICKECHNANYRAYASANRERVRQQKIDSNKRHRDELRERARKKAAADSVKVKRAAYNALYYIENRQKFRAHYEVAKAIKNGTLVRPETCEHCGSEEKIEGSHTDYSRPLDVEWLCPPCHRRKDYALRRVAESPA